jgi:hypothetical protein
MMRTVRAALQGMQILGIAGANDSPGSAYRKFAPALGMQWFDLALMKLGL